MCVRVCELSNIYAMVLKEDSYICVHVKAQQEIGYY